jgi:hypothetical protein
VDLRSIRNIGSNATVAAFKPMEIANFFNSRECKYVKERDDARNKATDLGKMLDELEND